MPEQCTNEKDLRLTYKVEELMPILGIGRNSAYELVRSGQIRSFRVGRNYRVPKDRVYKGKLFCVPAAEKARKNG